MLKEILPEGSNGILVSSTGKGNGQSETLVSNQITNTGTVVVSLRLCLIIIAIPPLHTKSMVQMGAGDFHSSKYDEMAKGSYVSELGYKYAIRESFYSGCPLDDFYCPMSVTIYPSEKTRHTPQLFGDTVSITSFDAPQT
jgi:hypothetical protein